jgi:hypothetical protein
MKQALAKVAKTSAATLSALAMSAQLAMISAADTGTAIAPPQGFATDFGKLINFVLRLVLVIGALLVFFYLIMGGIEWITSGGEKGKTEAARNKITAAVIGLIILAASYAILQLALSFLGLGDLNNAIKNVGTIN